jgi:hypothetical protein
VPCICPLLTSVLGWRKGGRLEYCKVGFNEHMFCFSQYSIIPTFHYSIVPSVKTIALQEYPRS